MRRRDLLLGSSALVGTTLLGCGGMTSTPASPRPASAIRIVDLMPEFFRFMESAPEATDEAAAARFVDEFARHHAEVYAPDVLGFDGEDPDALARRVAEWMPHARELSPAMRELHAGFLENLDANRSRFLNALPDFDFEGNVYLIPSVDAFNGAGRMVDGEPALLFGLDVIAHLENAARLPVLFHHELFHMYQAPAQTVLAEAVWVEGLATYASIALNPGTTDAQALPHSHIHDPEDPRISAPERGVSLDEVMPPLIAEMGPMLRQRMRSSEHTGSPDDYAMFFEGRAAPSLGPRPVRSAYFFGLELVRRIAGGRSLAELAAIEPATLVTRMEAELDAMITAART